MKKVREYFRILSNEFDYEMQIQIFIKNHFLNSLVRLLFRINFINFLKLKFEFQILDRLYNYLREVLT